MNKYELYYKNLIKDIISDGVIAGSRAGVVKMLPMQSLTTSLSDGFPVITGRKIFYKKAITEFEWMWNGDTNIKYLNEYGIRWWDSYADEDGNLGKIYGYQIRTFGGHFDQFAYCIRELSRGSRRAIITFWNPTELKEMALPPCYTNMTFIRVNDMLHMEFNLRSSDVLVGLPYDVIIGMKFLTTIARASGLEVGNMKLNLANAHIYLNNTAAVEEYLNLPWYELPKFNSYYNIIDDTYIHGPIVKTILNV